jgi:hypothetical protein
VSPQAVARPNVVLVISDDQGECHYGSAGECRSTQTGTPIPAPATPGARRARAGGTTFAIAHNTASWCYPSLNSILTGRYQKSFGGFRSRIAERYATIPRSLRQLGKAPGTVVDPFDADARIGGYCTIQGGKFTASSGATPASMPASASASAGSAASTARRRAGWRAEVRHRRPGRLRSAVHHEHARLLRVRGQHGLQEAGRRRGRVHRAAVLLVVRAAHPASAAARARRRSAPISSAPTATAASSSWARSAPARAARRPCARSTRTTSAPSASTTRTST